MTKTEKIEKNPFSDENLPSGRPSIHMSLHIAKKNLTISFRYPVSLLFWSFIPILWWLPLVFQGQALVGGFESSFFAQITGTADFLTFLIIGNVLYTYVMSAIWGAGNSIRWEQESGTLEAVFVTPINRIDMLFVASLSEAVYSTITAVVQFIVLVFIFQVPVSIFTFIPSVAFLVLMLTGMYGMGLVFAGIVLFFKDTNILAQMTDQILSIISPIRYPTSSWNIFPVPIRILAFFLPITLALLAIRGMLLLGWPMLSFTQPSALPYAGILVLVDLILWLLGYLIFQFADNKTRKRGKVGAF